MADRKMIHFIPCTTSTSAIFGNDDESDLEEPVDAWGLYDDGSTEALLGNADGILVPASKQDGFKHLAGLIKRVAKDG